MQVDSRVFPTAMSFRSRSRSLRRHASTELDAATDDDVLTSSVALHTPPTGDGEALAVHLIRPQVAAFSLPMPTATDLDLDPVGTIARAELRRCSIRSWWKIRFRLRASGGVSQDRLQSWAIEGWPGDVALNSVTGWALAAAVHDVLIDEPSERMLWSTWGEPLWLLILRAERDHLVALGLPASLDREHLLSDISLGIPPSPFGIMPSAM